MKLFIANCSPHIHKFRYRLPEAVRAIEREIRPGATLCLDLSADDIHSVVSQHERYGLVHVKKRIPGEPFAGLCWSEHEISVSAIRDGRELYDETVDERSATSLNMEVLAADQRMSQIAQQNGARPPEEGLEVSIDSESPDGLPEEKPVSKKIKVKG